jgi:hypothetical protein
VAFGTIHLKYLDIYGKEQTLLIPRFERLYSKKRMWEMYAKSCGVIIVAEAP